MMKGRRKPEGPGEPFGRGFVMLKRIEREPRIVQADFRVPILLPFFMYRLIFGTSYL